MSPSEIEAYKKGRDTFINEDRSFRRDNIWKAQRSSAEIKADELVRKLRAYEASTIWKEKSESIPHPFPGMEFLTGAGTTELLQTPPLMTHVVGRNIIVRTRIYQILSKVDPTCSAPS